MRQDLTISLISKNVAYLWADKLNENYTHSFLWPPAFWLVVVVTLFLFLLLVALTAAPVEAVGVAERPARRTTKGS